jgi:hypothetical protein
VSFVFNTFFRAVIERVGSSEEPDSDPGSYSLRFSKPRARQATLDSPKGLPVMVFAT